jgi:ketosteroid isomerase-like protein
MARTAVALAAVLALVAGCGKTTPEDEVRSAVQGYAKAFAERDYQALCDVYFDPKVVAGLERSGLPCESAIRPKVSSTRNPKLTIRTVSVDGDTAKVQVHTTATGELATDDTLALVKTAGRWRITPLGAGPQPTGP